jgi:hypothetical protein
MNITFIIGPEESFKEKVFSDFVHDIYVNNVLDRLFADSKYTASAGNLKWYGTKPNWAQLERVEKVIENSREQTEQVVITGWHLPSLMSDLITNYPDATFILVRGWSGMIDREMLQKVVLTQMDIRSRNAMILDQNTGITKALTDNNITPEWVRVSDVLEEKIFDKGVVAPSEEGNIEIAIFKGSDAK